MGPPPTDDGFPLAGVRVLDLSRAISGPYVGRILSDLGADVVKLEVEGADITHVFGPATSGGQTGLYVQQNAGKRNISVDLHADGGPELVRRLAGTCDLVIENFRPGTVDRLGVGWAELSGVNPRLVMLSVSGFGQWGPEAQRQAYAPVIHAESGLLGRQGQADHRRADDLVLAMADSVAALHGAIAGLAALRHAERTGVGQHIDLGMLEAVLASDDYVHYSLEGTHDRMSLARGRLYDAPGGTILISADPKYLWHRLQQHAGLTDPDPGATGEARFAARDEVVRAWVASFPDRPALITALEAAGLAWAEVRTPADLTDSPTLQARGLAAQVDDRAGGTRPVIRMPYRFSAARSEPRGGAPYVGEHNAEVLAEWLSLGADEVAGLVESKVLLGASSPRAVPEPGDERRAAGDGEL
jgi:CoA:oxalate CoA-transferase